MVSVLRSPGQVFIETGPVEPEGKGKQPLFQGQVQDPDATDGIEVPHLVDVAWHAPFQGQDKDHVVNQEQYATDPNLFPQIRTTPEIGRAHV